MEKKLSFETGDQVMTPGGAGTVIYKRMKSPDYIEVSIYSIRLDCKKDDPNYTGSTYSVGEIKPIDKSTTSTRLVPK